MNYTLVIKKGKLVAYPENTEGLDLSQSVGKLEGIVHEDFNQDTPRQKFIPLRVYGSLESCQIPPQTIQTGLEILLCHCPGIDSRMARSEEVINEILAYEILQGKLYAVRYTGRIIKTSLFFLGMNDNLSMIEKKLRINGEEQPLIGEIGFEAGLYTGKLEAFKAGTLTTPRMAITSANEVPKIVLG